MNVDNLTKLADLLDHVPAESFTIDWWQRNAGDPAMERGDKLGSCGFSGCAMGWAVHENLFPELSFCKSMGEDVLWHPETGLYSFRAAAHVMEITNSDAKFLFAPGYYVGNPTPARVASRIRQFIIDGEANHAD